MLEKIKLDVLLKEFDKQEKGMVKFAKEDIGKQEFIPFGIPSVDNITGVGGIGRGRITEISGMDGTFKTTLALNATKEAQKVGDTCAFIDVEHAFSPEYAEKIGVDTSKLILVHPNSAEEAFLVMERLIDTGEIGLIVLDSIAALCPTTEQENEFGKSNIGVMARLMGQMLRKLTAKISKTNTAVILLNQQREMLGGYVPMKTTPGGNSVRFYSSLRLEVTKAAIKEGTDVIGVTLKVKCIKNKLQIPFKIAEIEAIFGEGIDILKDILGLAIDKGIITKGGAWLAYKDIKLQGIDKFKQLCQDNPELLEEIKSQL